MKHCFDILKNKKLGSTIYILIGVLLALLNAFSASYFQKVLDDFGESSLSKKTIAVYAIVLILIGGLSYFDEYPGANLSEGIYLDFKLKAMEKMSTIDYQAYQSLGTGSLVQKIENGASSGKRILFDFYFRLFRELLPSMLFSLIFIARISKDIMIYIALGYIVIFVVTNLLLKYLYHIKAQILNNEEIFNKYLIRSFTELVVFRIHKKFPKEISKATNAAEQIVHSKTKMTLIHEAFFAVFAFFVTLIKVVILFASWKSGSISVGALVALLTLTDKAYSPIAIFNVLFVQYKLDRSAFARYSDFLALPDDLMLGIGGNLESVEGNLSFKNVYFSYEEKQLFTNLSFDIPAGTSVALIGESGSGKTTIVKQIIGLLKPDSGTIYLDTTEMSEINLHQLYNHVSYTSQDSPIFDGTLRENIVFDAKFSDDKILEALDNVGLTAFYQALPNGLSTEVGEKGGMLSGGERQRIALARLYFSEARIVILDEATSAMDNVTEKLVMKNLMRFLKKKTIITIAHRLHTITEFEKIYVFKEGRIVGEGCFRELMEHNAYFGQLWHAASEK